MAKRIYEAQLFMILLKSDSQKPTVVTQIFKLFFANRRLSLTKTIVRCYIIVNFHREKNSRRSLRILAYFCSKKNEISDGRENCIIETAKCEFTINVIDDIFQDTPQKKSQVLR